MKYNGNIVDKKCGSRIVKLSTKPWLYFKEIPQGIPLYKKAWRYQGNTLRVYLYAKKPWLY
jgi:hypothetical protein